MKDKTDNILRQRLATAWDFPPMPQGARERFLDRLEREEHPRHRRRGLYIGASVAIAAAVVCIVLMIVRPDTDHTPVPTRMDLTIAEVKGYYKARMWSESEYIIMLADALDEDTRLSLLQEVRNLEQGPDSLVESLLKEPVSDDIKIRYITRVYTTHLRSMQQIHSMLDDLVAKK